MRKNWWLSFADLVLEKSKKGRWKIIIIQRKCIRRASDVAKKGFWMLFFIRFNLINLLNITLSLCTNFFNSIIHIIEDDKGINLGVIHLFSFHPWLLFIFFMTTLTTDYSVRSRYLIKPCVYIYKYDCYMWFILVLLVIGKIYNFIHA